MKEGWELTFVKSDPFAFGIIEGSLTGLTYSELQYYPCHLLVGVWPWETYNISGTDWFFIDKLGLVLYIPLYRMFMRIK